MASVEAVMLTKALNLPAKIMTGYNGTEDQMAMRHAQDSTVDRLTFIVGKFRK